MYKTLPTLVETKVKAVARPKMVDYEAGFTKRGESINQLFSNITTLGIVMGVGGLRDIYVRRKH